jgi:hypothetical protein
VLPGVADFAGSLQFWGRWSTTARSHASRPHVCGHTSDTADEQMCWPDRQGGQAPGVASYKHAAGGPTSHGLGS